MTTPLNLDAYFERIHWGGDTRPVYDTLAGLLHAHMQYIPFENLDVLLGRPPRLDLDSLQAKLVRAKRGGYCFEQVTLFAAVLEQLGFEPVRHLARVVMVTPRNAAPRTHMFLTVQLPEGRFLLDAGFGGHAPRVPVPLEAGGRVQYGEQVHGLVRDGRFWVLQTQVDGKMSDLWASTLEEEFPIDFEMGNHYTASYPASPFVNRLMLRAFTPTGRVTVMNRDVTVWTGNTPQASQLADRQALRGLLTEHFGFDLPEVEMLRVPAVPEWS